jgi:hypothetical protein
MRPIQSYLADSQKLAKVALIQANIREPIANSQQ